MRKIVEESATMTRLAIVTPSTSSRYNANAPPPAAVARASHLNPATAVGRWAGLVIQVASAETDVPTMADWARLVRMSDRTLRARCETVRACPRDSLDLGRLLRAIALGDPEEWQPEAVLDVSDGRTLRRLLTRGGVAAWHHRRRPDVITLVRQNALAVPRSGLLMISRILAD